MAKAHDLSSMSIAGRRRRRSYERSVSRTADECIVGLGKETTTCSFDLGTACGALPIAARRLAGIRAGLPPGSLQDG